MTIFEILHCNAQKYPDRIIWEDELFGQYSLRYTDETSSRIYAFLDDKKIKTEDVVAICMKRSARIFCVMLGILKCGAAFVVIGENSPQNYVEQVLIDTEPKLIFDDDSFEQAMTFPIKDGYHSYNLHDLACIIYSTGSSGIFKGSMHEYGSFNHIVNQLNEGKIEPLYKSEVKPERSVIACGFYTIDAVIEMLVSVIMGYYYYIIPFDAMLDFSQYLNILKNKEIGVVCVAPNTYKKMKQNILPSLKRIDLSLDITIDDLNENYGYTNSYALTETFGTVLFYPVDTKQYDVIPAGKPYPLTTVMIIDKNGKEQAHGELGEICVVTEYFRGYANHPELTEKVLYDGWFHTGDMGYVDCNGNYVVLGRKIDMLETQEGYIVPTLISVKVKKLFPDISKSYIKLFKKENEIKICLYYCSDNEYSIDEFRAVLKGNIPDYMMPTHCIRKDDFEYFAFGKINRLSFEEPK